MERPLLARSRRSPKRGGRLGVNSTASSNRLTAVGASNPSLPGVLAAPRQFSERLGHWLTLPIQYDRNSRNKLVQEVEVADIAAHYAGTDTPRLKIHERIVEVFPLMTRTLRRAAETKELARKHSRFAPRRRIRSLQAMPPNVFNHLPHRLQNPTR